MIYILANITIRPEAYETVRQAALTLMTETQKEPGCLRYELFQSVASPGELVMIEEWESREALAPHFDTPHVKAWREIVTPHIIGRSGSVIHPARVDAL